MSAAEQPDWRAAVHARIKALHLSPERESEIVDEVAQHLDDRYRERLAAGLDADTALAAAWRELEDDDVLGRELARSDEPRVSGVPAPGSPVRGGWLRSVWQDVRAGLRSLRRQPTLSATVVCALALAIGPNTAILSLGNWLLWRPLPGATHAGDLALVEFFVTNGERQTGWGPSYPNRRDLMAGMTTAVGLEGFQEVSASLVVGDAPPRLIELGEVNGGFFDVLGVRMSAGRPLRADEDRAPAGSPVVVIGHGLALSAFGSPEGALGQRLLLNRQPFRVVGVANPAFVGATSLSRVDAWITAASMSYLSRVENSDWATARNRTGLSRLITRINRDATPEQVAAELTLLADQLVDAYPDDNGRYRGVEARVGRGLATTSRERASIATMVNILLAIGGVLLLLGCANVANVLLARAIRREHEVAVRKALGASRARLVQMQVIESGLLALGGAITGLTLAVLLNRVIPLWLFPRAPEGALVIPIDLRVLAMTAGTALVVGLVAGFVPAWLGARARAAEAIGRGTRTASRSPRLRTSLAIVQLALSLTLLIGAVLLTATLRNMRGVDLGFDPSGVTMLQANLRDNDYTAERAAPFLRGVLESLSSFGPAAATVADRAPFSSGFVVRVQPPTSADSRPIQVWTNGIAHNYFETLRTPIVAGRAFTADEAFATEPADATPVIVNETFARQLFGTTEVIGRTVELTAVASRPARHSPIIGVVRDARWSSLDRSVEPFLYQPIGRSDGAGLGRAAILVRSTASPREVGDQVRLAAVRLDPLLPLSEPYTLQSSVDSEMRSQRLFGGVLSWLSALAFALAAIGLHGLVAQTTGERTREFGIRAALGATRADIARLVCRYVALVAVLGAGIGLGFAALSARLVESMLFGISALDPGIYVAAVVTLVLTVAIAAAAPVVRATRVQPVDVLRAE